MRSVILDVNGLEIDSVEKEYLAHPLVAGVILFTRNFASVEQLKLLISQIRAANENPLLIAVDHEGGRVQRFRDGFTKLPACGSLFEKTQDLQKSIELAKASGFVMAKELVDCGVDISFAPVLDVNGISDVIKDRSFSDDPQLVIELARAYIDGMRLAGMASTGKHFPGHGSVKADSHVALPIDKRSADEIFELDIKPFTALIDSQHLDAIMPSHVVYEQCDALPSGFSPYWLQKVLKEQLAYKGAIFSDDLSMHGASFAGDHLSRANSAITAGCDFILACNDSAAAMQILDGLELPSLRSETLINQLLAKPNTQLNRQQMLQLWTEKKQLIEEFVEQV